MLESSFRPANVACEAKSSRLHLDTTLPIDLYGRECVLVKFVLGGHATLVRITHSLIDRPCNANRSQSTSQAHALDQHWYAAAELTLHVDPPGFSSCLGDKLTTNLPVMPERINYAPQSPAVFLPYRENL